MNLITISLIILGCTYEIAGQDCDQVLQRPNIYKMSDSDRNRYFNAVRAVNSGSKPTEWDKFAQTHVRYFDNIHNKPMFEAWHTKYLAELEKMLRNKDSKIRIPYWDWSQYYGNRDQDPIWGWFGKEGSPDGEHCIRAGEFRDFKVFYGDDLNDPGREKCLTRKSTFDSTFGCPKDYINQYIIDEQNPETSWRNLEYNCHNSVHSAIGEGFSSLISTNDPLFFSHHANVDRIWYAKQMRYPNQYDSFAESIDDRLPTYDIPIRDVLDSTNLCYVFPDDGNTFSAASDSMSTQSTQSTQSSPKAEPFVPLMLANSDRSSGSSIIKAIDDHARKYVFKNITSPINKPQSETTGPKCKPLPLRDIVSIEYIKMMHSDEVLTRELERQQALDMENLNKRCL
jgi:hypothetical protein